MTDVSVETCFINISVVAFFKIMQIEYTAPILMFHLSECNFLVPPDWLFVRSNLVLGLTYDLLIDKLFAGLLQRPRKEIKLHFYIFPEVNYFGLGLRARA